VVKYKTDLFDASTMKRFLEHFRVLVEQAIVHPEKPVAALQLLSEPERRQVIHEWNQTASDYPRDKCVHQLVEEQARQRPDDVSVTFEGSALTYADLDRQANQLAHHLVGLGIRPETRVGLCFDRCPELIIGILGVLKAGGAYVPLDPTAPANRLAFMLRDADVRVLLTQNHLRASLPECSATVRCLDQDWPLIARSPETPCPVAVVPDNLAYIIYTSGSTGEPKGVLVPHRGLTNVIVAHIQSLEARPGKRVLQLVFPHFDAGQAEIFRTLAAGATLCMAPADSLLPGASLVELMRDQAMNIATFPSSVLTAMPRSGDALPALGTLVVGGEACPPETIAHWSTGRRFLIGYGPTETTICSTMADRWDAGRPAPLGRPIANTQVYALDEQLQPVPVGVPGQLHVGGVGVTRGYLNEPALTAAKFIANPFSDQPGARLYRTGDRVRWLQDGTLEFLGRVDEQVKIRGFRVELGEIESVLGRHPGVRECTVLARQDGPTEPNAKRLVAYVAPKSEPAATSAELRAFLKEKLPEYMVPSAFVVLEAMPRKANGKVDRRALPAPEKSLSEAGRAYRPPRDDVEKQLVALWEQSLGVDKVGLGDNFFELGGHSLLAVRLIEQIKEQFGQKLPVATLFRHPTLEDLATLLRQKSTASDSPLVPIQPHGSKPPLFVVHPAEGNVLCYADLARVLSSGQPLYGFQAAAPGGDQPPARVEDMAAAYIALMRTVQPDGPYFLGAWSTGGLIAFEMAQQLLGLGQEVAFLGLIDTHLPSPDRKPPKIDPAKRMYEFAQEKGLDLGTEDFLKLPPEEQLTRFLERARAANVFPPGLGEEQIHRLYRRSSRTFQTQIGALQQYVARPYPNRISLFRATESQREGAGDPDPKLGWDKLADVDVFQIPGTHETMIREPHVHVLAGQLTQCLARVQAMPLGQAHSQ
jgi:amino acid adenylation domain-containing protein